MFIVVEIEIIGKSRECLLPKPSFVVGSIYYKQGLFIFFLTSVCSYLASLKSGI